MHDFKVGQKVRIVKDSFYFQARGWPVGSVHTITSIRDDGPGWRFLRLDGKETGEPFDYFEPAPTHTCPTCGAPREERRTGPSERRALLRRNGPRRRAPDRRASPGPVDRRKADRRQGLEERGRRAVPMKGRRAGDHRTV